MRVPASDSTPLSTRSRLGRPAGGRATPKRRNVLAPLVDEFFRWIRAQDELYGQVRGLVKKALGYAERQEQALRRFLQDGRLRMDNNLSENALRTIATGRKAFLFFGSDDTAEAAATSTPSSPAASSTASTLKFTSRR